MVRVTFIVVFIFLFWEAAYGQQALIDSLRKELSEYVVEDTNRTKILNRLSSRLYRSNPQESRIYSLEAIRLSKSLGFTEGEAEGNRLLGAFYAMTDNTDSAIFYHKKSLQLFTSIDDKRGIAVASAAVGSSYAISDQFENAIGYFITSLRAFEEMNNYSAVGIMYSNVGNLYLEQKLFDDALSNYERSIESFKKTENLISLANTYGNMSIALRELGRVEESLEYIELGLENAREYNNLRSIGFLTESAGNTYLDMNQYERARTYFSEAKNVYEQIGSVRQLVQLNVSFARVEYELKNLSNARSLLLATIPEFVKPNINLNKLHSDALELLSIIETEIGDPKNAVEYALKSKSISDSLHQIESVETIARLQTEYETEKKEREIQLLEAENEAAELKVLIAILTGVGFILILATIYWQTSKRRARERQLELQSVQRELSNYGVLIAEKDSLLNKIGGQLKELGKHLNSFESKKELNTLLDDLRQSVNLTDDENQLFQRIEQVNSGFFKELDTRFGSLSKNEKRLASLVEMELSNKEIGGILSINPKSVVQARYRLKKKLGLTTEEDLSGFLKALAR